MMSTSIKKSYSAGYDVRLYTRSQNEYRDSFHQLMHHWFTRSAAPTHARRHRHTYHNDTDVIYGSNRILPFDSIWSSICDYNLFVLPTVYSATDLPVPLIAHYRDHCMESQSQSISNRTDLSHSHSHT